MTWQLLADVAFLALVIAGMGWALNALICFTARLFLGIWR